MIWKRVISVTDNLEQPIPRLPVLLVHGVDVRDESISDSTLWGRIPELIRARGNSVWFGNQDAWGTVKQNSQQLAYSISEVIERTGAKKLHIIAHSKGGLDSRYCIHMRGVADQVASLVTLSTPNHGLKMCNALSVSKLILPRVVAPIINRNAKKRGDIHPDAFGLLHSLTTHSAEKFLEENPDIPGIEYRSYGFKPQPHGVHKLNLVRDTSSYSMARMMASFRCGLQKTPIGPSCWPRKAGRSITMTSTI